MKLTHATKLHILAQILLFDTLDHSKMHLCDFWMIHHVPYCSLIVNTTLYYLYIEYEVHPTDQSRDIDIKVNGSFKNFTHVAKNSVKNQEKFSRTCSFRGDFRESFNFHIKLSNIANPWLDFRQNPFKVEKPLKMAVFGTVL